MDGALQDFLGRAPPAAMHGRDDPAFLVRKEHRQAIGRPDDKEEQRLGRDQAVALHSRPPDCHGRVDNMHDVGVDLHENQRMEPPPAFDLIEIILCPMEISKAVNEERDFFESRNGQKTRWFFGGHRNYL
jgi:hypothetical protein